MRIKSFHALLVVFFGTLMLCLPHDVFAQLNENCTVSVLNRTVRVNADGSWVLPNIPANFGQVKARATCVENGLTIFGESDFFTVPANGAANLPQIALGAPTQVPVSVAIAPALLTLTGVGQTVQLVVMATYPDNSTKNITAAATGTDYTTSNKAIATISANGLVTAVSSGTVVIQATNDGAAGIRSVKVVLSTTDSDGDGIPDDIEISLGLDPHNPIDAQEDFDRDNLTNLQEYLLGTDIRKADTDGDGLSDGDEVNIYHSSPLLADTDGDKIPDGVEISTGSNPLDPASYDLKKAAATSVVLPPSFTLTTSALFPSVSTQLIWKVTLIDGKTTLDMTNDPRSVFATSNFSVCNFGVTKGQVFSGLPGTCIVTIRNNNLSVGVPGTVNTFTPFEVSSLSVAGAVAVDVAGPYAYIAAGSSGLKLVDITDRAQPALKSTLANLGDAEAVRVLGNFILVADANGFLRVVNVLNPSSPVPAATLSIPGKPIALAVHGNMAAVAAQAGGVSLVDVTNPAIPSLIATFSTGSSALGVDFDPARNLAAVAMGGDGLRLMDISNPAAPVPSGLLSGGDVRRVIMKYPAALLADVSRSVTSVDISNPAVPKLSTSLDATLGGAPVDIASFGGVAITADASFGRVIPVIDVQNPLVPVTRLFWTLSSPGFSTSIAMDNSFGYLIIPGSLRIFKYQNIQDGFGISPTIAITFPINGVPVIQGETITVAANALDDVAVASVSFSLDGKAKSTVTLSPYQLPIKIADDASSATFEAMAIDYGNNIGAAVPVTVPVIPDPLTTVTGVVVDASSVPILGAAVTYAGQTATSALDGSFTLPGASTILGNVVASARFIRLDGVVLAGRSGAFPPVRGGVTAVGTITMKPIPTISSISQGYAFAGDTVSGFKVVGENLTGSTFGFIPAGAMTISSTNVASDGKSATFNIAVSTTALGTYTLVATNSVGTSDPATTKSNRVIVPANPQADTDGDGFADGLELILGSNLNDRDSIPDFNPFNREASSLVFSALNTAGQTATAKETSSVVFSALNTAGQTATAKETSSVVFSALNTAGQTATAKETSSVVFSALNTAGQTATPKETSSVVFSALNTAGQTATPKETSSVVFSALNTAGLTSTPKETLSVPFSVCNGSSGCPNSVLSGIALALSNPGSGAKSLPDSDGDGISNEDEIRLGLNPFVADTDGDGYPDGLEVILGSDPLDPKSIPVIKLPNEAFPQSFSIQNSATGSLFVPKGDQNAALQSTPQGRPVLAAPFVFLRHVADLFSRVRESTSSADVQQRFQQH